MRKSWPRLHRYGEVELGILTISHGYFASRGELHLSRPAMASGRLIARSTASPGQGPNGHQFRVSGFGKWRETGNREIPTGEATPFSSPPRNLERWWPA